MSRGHVAGQRSSAVYTNTGNVFADRQQSGHWSHDAVGRRHSDNTVGGGSVHQAQSHAHRKGGRQGSFVRPAVGHTAVLSHHVRARAQTHRHRLRSSKVKNKKNLHARKGSDKYRSR